MKFLEILEQTLKRDRRFVGEDGRILKTKVYDACMAMDRSLLGHLMNEKLLKSHFFTDVNGIFVFDKTKFVWVLESREFLPDSFTRFKNKIGLAHRSGKLLSKQRNVTLVWPYKDCVLEGGQTKEDQKRNEIFYNETLAPDEVNKLLYPKVFTNAKRYSMNGVKKTTKIKDTDNLIIKGNNLLVLSSLLKRYEGEVKCIYIDPPYNTGSDSFKYNDSFNHSTYLTFMKNRLEISKRLMDKRGVIFVQCDINEVGYLTVLMKEIWENVNIINWQRASQRTVLGQGQTPLIDITEYILVGYDGKQKDVLNSVRKRFPVIAATPDGKTSEEFRKLSSQYNKLFVSEGQKKFVKDLETYQGTIMKIYKHDDYKIENIPNARFKTIDEKYQFYVNNFKYLARFDHQQTESSVEQLILNNIDPSQLYSVQRLMTQGKRKGQVVTSYYLNGQVIYYFNNYGEVQDGVIYRYVDMNNYWDDSFISSAGIANEGNVELKRGKKPEKLISTLLEMGSDEGDIVLDFFLGTGTTAAVAHKLGRRYLGCEQLDDHNAMVLTRLKGVIKGEQAGISKEVNWQGGGSFVYCELKEQNESIVWALQNAHTSEEVQAILNRVTDAGFIIPSVLPNDLRSHMDEFAKMPLEHQKTLVMELIDKNKLYVNLCDIDDEELAVSNADKAFTKNFYRMDENAMSEKQIH